MKLNSFFLSIFCFIDFLALRTPKGVPKDALPFRLPAEAAARVDDSDFNAVLVIAQDEEATNR